MSPVLVYCLVSYKNQPTIGSYLECSEFEDVDVDKIHRYVEYVSNDSTYDMVIVTYYNKVVYTRTLNEVDDLPVHRVIHSGR